MAFDPIDEADSVREKETLYKKSEYNRKAADSAFDKTAFSKNDDNSKPRIIEGSIASGSYFKASPRKVDRRN